MQCHILITFLCACIQILMSCLCKYTPYIMLGGLTSNGVISILCSAMVVPLMLVILLGAAQGMPFVHLQKDVLVSLSFCICKKHCIPSGQFSLTSPPMGTYSCPGSNITYTCVLSSSANAVITLWSGSAFQCPPTNQIGLTQRSGGVVLPFTLVPCGSLSAVTTNVTSTCYTSVLTIPAVQALNGATVVCGDGATGAVVGNDTLRIMSEL